MLRIKGAVGMAPMGKDFTSSESPNPFAPQCWGRRAEAQRPPGMLLGAPPWRKADGGARHSRFITGARPLIAAVATTPPIARGSARICIADKPRLAVSRLPRRNPITRDMWGHVWMDSLDTGRNKPTISCKSNLDPLENTLRDTTHNTHTSSILATQIFQPRRQRWQSDPLAKTCGDEEPRGLPSLSPPLRRSPRNARRRSALGVPPLRLRAPPRLGRHAPDGEQHATQYGLGARSFA